MKCYRSTAPKDGFGRQTESISLWRYMCVDFKSAAVDNLNWSVNGVYCGAIERSKSQCDVARDEASYHGRYRRHFCNVNSYMPIAISSDWLLAFDKAILAEELPRSRPHWHWGSLRCTHTVQISVGWVEKYPSPFLTQSTPLSSQLSAFGTSTLWPPPC